MRVGKAMSIKSIGRRIRFWSTLLSRLGQASFCVDWLEQHSVQSKRTSGRNKRPLVRLLFSSWLCFSRKQIDFKCARIGVIKSGFLLVVAFIALAVAVTACGNSTNVNGVSTSTPTPCVTNQTTVSGQSTFATPMSNQPTFSPEMQATAEARLRQANPGNPTYPAPGQALTQLPPCPTNTPSAATTVPPQNPGGGIVRATLAPSPFNFSPDQLATANARMQFANPGAPTTPH